MVVSNQPLSQTLVQTFQSTLSESALSVCLESLQVQQLSPGKQFWRSQESEPGIYVILAGKVRLFDAGERLIATLTAGNLFGELTLFAQSFQPYTARASVNLQVGYLSQQRLQKILKQELAFQPFLLQQAIRKDLLILCRQIDQLQDAPLPAIFSLLDRLESSTIESGQFAETKPTDAPKLWLICQGRLINKNGEQLDIGCHVLPDGLPSTDSWQATQPTELYCLSASNWQTVLKDLPQLAELSVKAEGRGSGGVEAGEPEGAEEQGSRGAGGQRQDRRSPQVGRAYFPSPTVRAGHLWQRVTRRYSFFAQQSASDCGAACLVMIGRYWGKRFSVNRLRDLANVDRNGASLRGLVTAAESLGFAARPVKASLKKLAEQPLPAIVHWEGKHYVVVYEITRKHVIVCDPAIGQRCLSHREFNAGWTGYALLLQPTVALKQAREASQPLWQFLELIQPHRLVLFEVLVASILIQVFGLITPILTQLLLDRVVVQRSELTLNAVGVGMLLFGLFRVALTGLRQYLLDHTAQKVDMTLIMGFIRHTFRLPLNFFETRYVGDIISRVQENRKIQRFLTGEALSIFLDLLTVIIYVGLMLWYSWKMALLTLAIVPPFVLLALVATPFLQRISREIFNAVAGESAYLIQALTGIHSVKSMGVEQSVRWNWEELLSKSVKTGFSGQILGNQLQIFSGAIEAVVTTSLLWFGASQVIQNQLTIGQLVAFNMLLGSVIRPFQRLIVLWNEIQEVIIAVERINDVIDTEPEEDLHNQMRQTLPPLRGQICFEQVTFRYHPESETNTLETIQFEAHPGQMIALVGRSGSGKTTLSKLLLGLYPPTQGKIWIDGYDVTTLSLRSLRQQIGVVDQNTFLFGGTIRENISIGHPESTLEDIIAAAQLAGAHEFIQKLPMGYETEIGEGGGLLSGGQRQRLAIARALLGNPRLLILDEATSSLDAESERIIQNNLTRILRGRTTFVIAHRLSTVRHADLILVLDRGIIVERGTHDELMSKRGHYFYLNQQQLAIAG